MDDEKRSRPSPAKGTSGADFAGLGIQFALAIVVFLFAGQWVDQRFNTNGLFTVVGVFVGAGGAFYSMYRKISAAQKQDDEERRARQLREAGSGKPER
jgi:F0F1-type ATP synthase assembly protein I